MDLSYEACYAVLDVPQDVTWGDLRRAYRRQIQKWHPDKIKYTKIDLKSAEQHFMAVQAAYSKLEQYYLINNTLPKIYLEDDKIELPNVKKTSTTYKKNNTHIAPILIFLIIPLIAIVYFSIYTDSGNNTYRINNDLTYPATSSAEHNTRPDNNPATNNVVTSHVNTINYGSTMRQVKNIQGLPSRIEDNIWYYGKSYIIFNNGLVADWHQDELNPLNTGLTSESGPAIANTPKNITLGLSKSEVRAIQGEPMQDLVDVWVYGASKIYFKNDHVVSWINSTLDPLKIEQTSGNH